MLFQTLSVKVNDAYEAVLLDSSDFKTVIYVPEIRYLIPQTILDWSECNATIISHCPCSLSLFSFFLLNQNVTYYCSLSPYRILLIFSLEINNFILIHIFLIWGKKHQFY